MRFSWMTAVSVGLVALAGVFVAGVVQGIVSGQSARTADDFPFYNDLPKDVQRRASDLYRRYKCRDCHVIWGVRNVMQMPPAPSLDGIGSLRSEEWIYAYLSSEDPQQMLPSRLKKRYRHPSYAHIPEQDRRLLARYFAHMRAKPWYLPEVRRAEKEALYGDASAQ
ncbi:MAG: cytochrome c [Zetaproteobacteria bacterium]|nr:MAG: cytochrome c [Zetaproteobacteria bacterium]